MKALLTIAAALVFGSGLAAATSVTNDPCLEFELSQAVPEPDVVPVTASTTLLPYGTRCAGHAFLGPGTAAFSAWLVATAVLLGLAVLRRRNPAVRGAAVATCVVGLFGLIGHQFGDFAPTVMATVIVASGLVFALDVAWRGNVNVSLVLCVTLPAAVMVVFCVLFLLGLAPVGVACAALVGAALSAAAERLGRGEARPFIPTDALRSQG